MSKSSSSSSSSEEETSSQSPPPPPPPPPPAPKVKLTSQPPKAGPPVSSGSSSDDDESSESKEEESQKPVRHQDPGPSAAPSKKRSHGDDKNGKSKSKKVKKAPSVQKPVATEKGKEKVPAAKSVPFGRIFSEEDEMALMRGLAEFCSANSADAASVVKNRELFEGFHASVGKTLHTSVTVEQLKNKIRRLKERRGKPGDSALTEMWDRLWRSEKEDHVNENDKGKSKNNLVENNIDEGKMLPVVSEELPPFLEESVRICSSEGRTMFGEEMIRKGVMLLDKEEVDSLEKKWKKMWMLDMKLCIRRIELERRKSKLINMEFMKISEAMTRAASL